MLPSKTVRALCLRLEALGFTRQIIDVGTFCYEKKLPDRTIWVAYELRDWFWLWATGSNSSLKSLTAATTEELELAVIYLSLVSP